LKKADVAPSPNEPNLISVCLTKSSAEFIGLTMFSTVRKAARLAVYELIKIRVKNHHTPAMRRAEGDLYEYLKN